jgi:hypothetical protein
MDKEQARPITGQAAGIRAADADRERMTALLRGHYVDGRLDASEFQERLERCMQAKTVGELRALAADLPVEDPGRAAASVRWFHRPPAWRQAVPAMVLTALIVASVFAGRPLFFPAVPFLFFWLRGFWWYDGWSRRSLRAAEDGRVLPVSGVGGTAPRQQPRSPQAWRTS